MTRPIPIVLCVDGIPVHVSGLRIDRRYQLPRPGGAPVPVEVLTVAAGVATVRGPDGGIFACPACELHERHPGGPDE